MSEATEKRKVDDVRDRLESTFAHVDQVQTLLANADDPALAAYLADFHPSDLADLVEELDEAERQRVLSLLPADVASETLAEMHSEEHPEELLAGSRPDRLLELIRELSDDDAADLIGELPPEEQARVLSLLPRGEAGVLRKLLQYHEESAGGIMTTELMAVSVGLSAGDAIQEVRRQARALDQDFYSIYVVDRLRRLRGTVGLRDLVVADPSSALADLLEPPATTVPVDMDQEDVARLMARYNVPSLPVVGPNDVLLGRVTFDDVMDVLEAEQTEDLFRLAGVSEVEEVRGGWSESVRARLPWLFLNLGTAALAAGVVYLFQDTISELVVLAAIMPVIAGLGGNAGTQALAVTVRRLAISDEPARRHWGVAVKEMLVGLINGVALGLVAGVAGYLVQGAWLFGLVVMLAMWGNLVVASFFGAFVPVMLERAGADPAVASSVFVTTATDIFGFFLLLGLAATLLT